MVDGSWHPRRLARPVLWAVVYPVSPDAPIGWIRHDAGGFRATFESEDLGVHPSGDAAVEAIWSRFLERARVEHELAARTHGGSERHLPG